MQLRDESADDRQAPEQSNVRASSEPLPPPGLRIGLKRFLTESNGGMPDDKTVDEVAELIDKVERGEVDAEMAARIRKNADGLLERKQITTALHDHIIDVLDKVK